MNGTRLSAVAVARAKLAMRHRVQTQRRRLISIIKARFVIGYKALGSRVIEVGTEENAGLLTSGVVCHFRSFDHLRERKETGHPGNTLFLLLRKRRMPPAFTYQQLLGRCSLACTLLVALRQGLKRIHGMPFRSALAQYGNDGVKSKTVAFISLLYDIASLSCHTSVSPLFESQTLRSYPHHYLLQLQANVGAPITVHLKLRR